MGLDITGLGSIFDFGSKLLDKFVVDKGAAAQAKAELLQALQQGDLAQLQVNANEASNPSVFVAGWRPAIGWVCALAMAYTYLVVPLGTWGLDIFHVAYSTPPKLDGNLWELMFGMLGMGSLRTFEKLKGVASK